MKKALLWILALILTLSAAVYQRLTGPTYPMRVKTEIAGATVSAKLPRTHESTGDCEIRIRVQNTDIGGLIVYKRHPTDDPWSEISMTREGEDLVGSLPAQPPAGKLEYRVTLESGGETDVLSGEEPVIIRFKGAVPIWILLPHVLIMFLAMLFSTRAGLEALRPTGNPRTLAIWTTGLLSSEE